MADAMICPRCRNDLGQGLVRGRGGDGGGYRDAMVRVHRCHECKVTVADATELAAREGLTDARLAGTILDRGRKTLTEPCPRDGLTSMEQITLSWASTWVMIEQCPDCGILVLDDGEAETLRALVGGAPEARDGEEREQAVVDALHDLYRRMR